MFPADWTSDDEGQLERELTTDEWEPRDPSVPIPAVKYWPQWTEPNFTPEVEFSFDGLRQRPASYGGLERRLRPAILPLDGPENPTSYARYV